jgi:NhaA family Na+:H+ antiporter
MSKQTTKKLLMAPFQWFFQRETSSGLVLFFAALLAIVWANSPWRQAYFDLWHLPLTLGFDKLRLSLSLHQWINDGLMAIFFFLVGLEIKRELLVGELSSVRSASLPILAAAGGMAVPGLLYAFVNPVGSPFNRGWGVPTVTDIAFSLGVLALLGNRVPLFLKVFLTALAIVDDLGAILIIALFYSSGIAWGMLGLSALILGVLFVLNRLGVRWLPAYLILGAALWLFMLYSGVHPTIAGVLLALTIPAKSKIQVNAFCEEGLSILKQLQETCTNAQPCSILTEADYQTRVQNIEDLCEDAQAPLQRLEHNLHSWVTFVIMPLFALANAGVSLSVAGFKTALVHPVALGVILGLMIGKQVGIMGISWLVIKLKLAELPNEIQFIHLYGLACLGGIGFTMSLFISSLAFDEGLQGIAKVGIIAGSVLSGIWGWFILSRWLPKTRVDGL